MRLLLVAVVAAAASWSAYWWVGARATDRAVADWFDGRRAAGWTASHAGIATRGFPNRFDTTIEGLELADPASGLAWTAPFLQVLRLGYRPRHLIAVLPPAHSATVRGQRIDVASDEARASLVFRRGAGQRPERSTFVATNLSLESSAGWTLAAERARLATRPSEDAPGAVDVGLAVEALRPSSRALALAGLVPDGAGRLRLDASVAFAAAPERRAGIAGIDLRALEADWGGIEIRAAGAVSVDREGRASGLVDVTIVGWRRLPALVRAAGWLPERTAALLEDGLGLLAGLDGSPDTLDAPVTLRDGIAFLGPVPLGEAPRLGTR